MKLKALKKIGRYQPGQTFDLKDKEARAFILMKIAVPVEEDDMIAVPVPVPARRAYRRRDLHAEE